MTPFQLLVLDWALMAAVMFGLWLRQLRTERADIVDLGWTIGVGASAVLFALGLDRGLPARRALVAALAVAWSARLALHLATRRIAAGEDGRYGAMRAEWGEEAPRRFLWFFQGQAVFVPLISGQFMLAMLHPMPALTGWDALGSIVVLGSILGESLADRQLETWKRDPANAGRTCRNGLWRYSRHPNYFFEWLHWLGYSVIAVGSPVWPATLLVPAIMYILVRYVTGIPPAEAQSLRSRGDDYRAYQRSTNAFFPGPPRGGPARLDRSRGGGTGRDA